MMMMMNGGGSCLGNAVLLASLELKGVDGLVPALMDSGPSSGTSCCKSLDGAMPGTFKPEDAGQISAVRERPSSARAATYTR